MHFLRRICLPFLVFLFFSTAGQAQLKGEFGAGLGYTFNSDDSLVPEDAIRSPMRFIFQAGAFYHFNKNWGIGFELSTSVFQRLNIFPLDIENTLEDGTKILDPQRTYSSLLALKSSYRWEWKGFDPYVSLGVGPNFLAIRTIRNTEGLLQTRTENQLSFIPEVGLGLGHFSVAFKSVIGGKISAFDETDSDGTNVLLSENRLLMFYITGSYHFAISKKK